MFAFVNRYYTVIYWRRLALALLPVPFFFACQDVIQVNLNNASPRMIIEGSLSNEPDTVKVILSKSTDYFNPQTIPMVTGAAVSITDNSRNVYHPDTTIDGYYFFKNLIGSPGKTYTLKVDVNGSEYTGSSTMPGVVPIDSLQIQGSSDGDKENVLYIYIHDPAGIHNYYRVKVYRNGKLMSPTDNTSPIMLFSDKYFDGRYTPLRVTSRRVGVDYFLPGDTLRVQLFSIDVTTYNFLRQLRDLTNSGGAFSTSTPDNPDNNLSNGAMGYFAAWAVSEGTLVVK
jgi:hypothetical protein